MLAVIGLGNPGGEYEGTRHNIGFDVVDSVAEKIGARFTEGRGDYRICQKRFGGRALILVKPLTYMNNSGMAVADIVERYALSLEGLLVVADDIHLPLGTLRLRPAGSAGGHNGLGSIIYHLGSEEVPRLRCGIAGQSMPNDKKFMAQYVLSPFEDAERPIVRKVVHAAREAVLIAWSEGFARALNEVRKSVI